MYGDHEGRATGRHKGGDNVAYGENRWGWLIGKNTNRILEVWWFHVYYLFEALCDTLRTLAGGALSVAVSGPIDNDDSLAEHALYT
jgi:hypothetical protein